MNKAVMIVDDDDYIRLAVNELFRRHDIKVLQADGAEQCIEHLRAGFSGVVLMDIMMPVKDGWDTIREIIAHDLFENIVIVMLTAKDVPCKKMEGLQEYVTDYFTKPFNPDELVSNVNEFFKLIDSKNA